MTRPFGRLNSETIKSQRNLFRDTFGDSSMTHDNKSSQYIVEILKMDELKGRGAHYYYLDMELCTMDLRKFVQGQPFRGETNIWKIMSQIASAVQFIHDHGIIIRDLKPSRSIPRLPRRRLICSPVLKEAGQRGMEAWGLQPCGVAWA